MTGDLIGKTFGGYQIIEQIGKGGMATIYKAYQPSLDRDVAIKILPPYYAEQDDSFITRFKREAKAVAKLRHPNLLIVMDTGEENGLAYIAMEYVEAGTLKERMAETLNLSEIYTLMSQLGSVLDYAHDEGVIHRDIKPSNILMPKPDWALLTDFGLAKMVGGSMLTQSGMTVGTPAYMSPEQGRGEKVDHRSDIYSLGVILYEMVVGEVPYTAETPMAVVVKHITDPLPLPIEKNPKVPEPLQKVILKALAKDPNDRYQNSRELIEALKPLATELPNWISGDAMSTPKPPSTPTMPESDISAPTVVKNNQQSIGETTTQTPLQPTLISPTNGRSPWYWVAISIGVIALIFGAISFGPRLIKGINNQPAEQNQQTGEGTEDQTNGDQPEEAPGGDESEQDEGNTDDQESEPTNSPTGNLMLDGRNALESGDVESAVQFFEAATREDPENIYDIYNIVVELSEEEGRPAEAADILLAGMAGLDEPDPYDYSWAGWMYYEEGELLNAVNAFKSGIEADPYDPTSYGGLNDTYYEMDQIDVGIAYLEGFAEIHPDIYHVYMALGTLYTWHGDTSLSEEAYQQALEYLPDDDPWALYSMADYFYYNSDNDQARELLAQITALGNQDQWLHDSVGWLYLNMEDYQLAKESFELSIEVAVEVDTWTYAGLATVKAILDEDPGEIISLLDEATADAIEFEDSYLMSTIGWAFYEMDDCESAIEAFNIALDYDEYNGEAEEGLRACG